MQRFGLLDDKIVAHAQDAWPRLQGALRSGALVCPYCNHKLGWGETGFIHAEPYPGHPPLDATWHKHVMQIETRLKRLFPSGTLQIYAALDGEIIDALLLTPQGGKLGVLIPGSSEDLDRLQRRYKLLVKNAVKPMVILPDHLIDLKWPKRSLTQRVRLEQLALGILNLPEAIWVSSLKREIWHVIPQPDTRLLWHENRSLGWVQAVIRKYPLGQLRMDSGLVAVLSEYDPPLPEFDPLPDRLLKRLQ